MIRLLPLLFFAFVIIAFMVALAATKSNGATDKPLLVDAQYQPQPAFRRFTPCPLSPRNIPLAAERNA